MTYFSCFSIPDEHEKTLEEQTHKSPHPWSARIIQSDKTSTWRLLNTQLVSDAARGLEYSVARSESEYLAPRASIWRMMTFKLSRAPHVVLIRGVSHRGDTTRRGSRKDSFATRHNIGGGQAEGQKRESSANLVKLGLIS